MGDIVTRNIEWTEYGQTVLTPITIIYILIMVLVQFNIDRRHLVIPILITAGIIPVMQRVVIASVDLTVVRILYIVSILRILLRNEHKSFRFLKIDKVMLAYSLISSLVYILQWRTTGAIVNRLAHILETYGVYIVIRIVIQDKRQIISIFRAMAIMSIFIAIFMTIEQFTGRNLFSVFGGVPEFTPIREGRLRSQGAFSHPILAGVFGALLIPMMWGILNDDVEARSQAIPLLGMFAGFMIMMTSSSSTPYIAFLASLFGITVWYIRNRIPEIIVLIVVMLIGLQLAMEAPIWFLMAKIDIVGGSTGYFRSLLFDQFVRRFPSWSLLGVRTTEYWGWGLQDITNQYVLEGVRGGLLSLILFFSILVQSFRNIKTVRIRITRNKLRGYPYRLLFSLGVVLFATSVVFMAVSYFGNMYNYFYLVIASIACMTDTRFTWDVFGKAISAT